MSAINVNSITGRTGSHGPVLTGITTATNGLHVTSGDVGIGTDSPNTALHISSTLPVLRLQDSDSTGNAALQRIEALPSTGATQWFVGQNSLTDTELWLYNVTNDDIRFGTNNAERVRITSGGNVGVGSTIPVRKLDVVDSGASGAVVRSQVTDNNGGYLAYEALNSSGTSVFSVSHNGRINLAEGINFENTGAGSSTTATSHILDDYEEGTWTPVISGSNVSGSLTYGNNNGARYTKIGRSVFLYGLIDWSANNFTAGTSMYISGLPFQTAATNITRSGIRFDYTSTPWTGVTIYHIGARTEESATHAIINYAPNTDGSWANTLNYNNLDSTGAIIFSGQYMVD